MSLVDFPTIRFDVLFNFSFGLLYLIGSTDYVYSRVSIRLEYS